MLPETVAKLAEVPNIVAIKEAAGAVDQVKEIRALTPDSFKIYSGDDALTLDFMEAGAVGVVSVASHIVGKQIKEMITCFNNGDSTDAREIEQRLAPLFEVLFIESNPVPVKHALGLLGFPMGAPRLPLVGLSLDSQKIVEECVDRVLGVS